MRYRLAAHREGQFVILQACRKYVHRVTELRGDRR